MSVYDYAGRIEYWLKRIEERGKEEERKGKGKEGEEGESEEGEDREGGHEHGEVGYRYYDHELARSFLDALRLAGIREGRVQSYAQFTYRIMEIMHDLAIEKRIADLTREDIDRIAGTIASRRGWGNSTIALALRTLKRLVHYAKHKEIAEGEGNYCEEVEHIHPDRYMRKAMKEEVVKATDILTREEFLKLVEAVPRVSRYPLRDRAMLYVMYEFASRPSELLNMRVGDIMLEDQYAIVSSYGKTGKKTLTLVLSYNALRDWLEQHPERDNPEAYLWYSKRKNKQGENRVSYDRLRLFIKRLAEVSGVSRRKRVWLYLIRHTALTHVEKELGSSITEMYGNWRKGSPIRNRYIHLANSDQHEAVLRKYGLLNEASSSSTVSLKRCYRCSNLNEPTARVCRFCGLILDHGYALRLHGDREERIKELEDRLRRIQTLVEELIGRDR